VSLSWVPRIWALNELPYHNRQLTSCFITADGHCDASEDVQDVLKGRDRRHHQGHLVCVFGFEHSSVGCVGSMRRWPLGGASCLQCGTNRCPLFISHGGSFYIVSVLHITPRQWNTSTSLSVDVTLSHSVCVTLLHCVGVNCFCIMVVLHLYILYVSHIHIVLVLHFQIV